jgi:hypothetical protein
MGKESLRRAILSRFLTRKGFGMTVFLFRNHPRGHGPKQQIKSARFRLPLLLKQKSDGFRRHAPVTLTAGGGCATRWLCSGHISVDNWTDFLHSVG